MLKISMSENACSIKIQLFFFIFFFLCENLSGYVHLPLYFVVLCCVCMSSQLSCLLHITLNCTFKVQINVWLLL